MNELKIFENSEFGQVRTMLVDGEPYFVGKEVAEILGYSNTQKAIRDHVDRLDKLTERIVLSGQNREVILINESGLYSLILSSKMPRAREFKHWVTSEILPSIRRHGLYAEMGYTSTKTHSHPGKDGDVHATVHTYWTQKGRLFIYSLLKENGILPMVERGETA